MVNAQADALSEQSTRSPREFLDPAMPEISTGRHQPPSLPRLPSLGGVFAPSASVLGAFLFLETGMSSVTFETSIGVEGERVFVMAHFDPDGDVEFLTVAPLVENRVQMDIAGYLDEPVLKRLRIQAVAELLKEAEQARADAEIERHETEKLYGRAA